MEKLTNREKDVCNLIIKGLSNKEIAEELYISVHTVKANLEHIYEKLKISNRVLLAIYITKALLSNNDC